MQGPNLNNLTPTYLFTSLSGNRIFKPAVIEPNSCGVSVHENNNIFDCIPSDPVVQLDEQLLHLQLAVDEANKLKEQDFDRSYVHEKTLEIYPCRDASREKSPKIYERDVLNIDQQQKWMPRIQMLEVAHQTESIFTISIVPKDPKVCQTWYQKRILTPSTKPWQSLGSKDSNSRSRSTNCPQTEESLPKKQLGFLKPFTTFSSDKYAADPIFDKIDAVWLKSVEDAAEVLEDIKHPELKDRFITILNHFLADGEADSLGLIFLHEGKGCAKLFHKA